MGLKNSRQGVVESFFIQHSLPRFPLPKSQSIFDQNIKQRAQHFFCFSLQDQVEQNQKYENRLIPLSVSVKNSNFFKLLWHYTRTVNVNFYYDPAFERLNSFASIAPFEEILKSIPNFPTYRAAAESDNFHPIDPLASFFIQSTGDEDTRLNLQIFAKAPNNNIDIYDDVTALLSIHHQDYKVSSDIKTGHVDKKSAMLMIAQSHVDPSTLGINQKTLVDREGYYATVHVLNSSGIELPKEDGTKKFAISMYRDHSKWSVNVTYGIEGPFPALLCFYDLNRSTKQASRGGAAFCLNSSLTESSRSSMALWQLFMSLKPKPTTMARFNEAKISTILDQIIPQTEIEAITAATLHSREDIENGITRGQASKKRKLSIGKLSPISPLLLDQSVKLPKVKHFDFESELGQLHVVTNQGEDEITVPCPYKYRDSQVKIESENSYLPSKIVCYIVNKIERYGCVALNSALNRFGFEIRELSNASIFATPKQKLSNSRHMYYTHNTLLVNKKQPSLNEIDETSETVLDDITYSYSYLMGNKTFSDDEKEKSSEMDLNLIDI